MQKYRLKNSMGHVKEDRRTVAEIKEQYGTHVKEDRRTGVEIKEQYGTVSKGRQEYRGIMGRKENIYRGQTTYATYED